VKPTVFFSVPRVWEKMYEKMQTVAASSGFIVKTVGKWAKSLGKEGTLAQIK
jgi:long-chain-fatty-acid--CoA ligase ACSBG